MRSTPEMRARIRELMTYPHDDYDRAVECALNDFEALEAALAMIVLSSKDSASVEIARAALDPTAHIDWDILAEERLEQRARAALAPEQEK